MHGLWWAGKMLDTTLVSQHVEWGWKEEKQMWCCIHSSFLWVCACKHESWRHGRSRWNPCCLRFLTIDALARPGLSVCVRQSDGQVHKTHETTRTQDGFSHGFICVLVTHKTFTQRKIKERDKPKKHAPHPGPSCFRTQMSEQLLMAGDTYRHVWGGERGGMEA